MLVERFVRGNIFAWSAAFTDTSGDVAEPDSVTLYVRYIDAAGVAATDEIEMDGATDGTWSGVWDSSVSKKCRVAWAIRAVNPPGAKEGVFDLDANLANPDPETDA